MVRKRVDFNAVAKWVTDELVGDVRKNSHTEAVVVRDRPCNGGHVALVAPSPDDLTKAIRYIKTHPIYRTHFKFDEE